MALHEAVVSLAVKDIYGDVTSKCENTKLRKGFLKNQISVNRVALQLGL